MSYSHFPIQGVTSGGVHVRQEIDSWFLNGKNAAQVALFFLALKKFQGLEPLEKDGKLSYYQIAGIHGQPNQRWDNAPPPPAPDLDFQTGGYCAHGISTFPTWHRPYLLLFEQRIWEIMKEIIRDFEASDEIMAEWNKAADTWRLPYWDWSKEYVPKAVRTNELNIVAPVTRAEKVEGTLDNPLNKFTNPSGVPMGDSTMGDFAIPPHEDKTHGKYPWDRCISTSRWGVVDKKIDPTEDWIKGVVLNGKVDQALKNHGWYDKKDHGTIKEVVYLLFSTKFTSWETFATTRYDKTLEKPLGQEFLSLEYVHNNVHNWAGGEWMNEDKLDPGRMIGAGHMSDVDVSAFDPIFYLHHCNIDRLLAIWQKLNPTLWFNKLQKDEPKPSDPLWPFWRTEQGDPWTSNACREVTDLHYSYDLKPPEKGGKTADEVDLLDELRRSINKQYGSTGSARRLVLDSYGPTEQPNDYIVNIVYDRFAYGGAPYTIYFFLSNPEEKGATCIGSVYNFSSSRRLQEGSCGNCQQQKAHGTLSRALVPITVPLLHRAQNPNFTDIGSLDLDAVEVYLKEHLEWKVVIGGRIIDATEENVQGLTVFAMKGKATHYQDETKLSEYYDYEVIEAATNTKANGLKDASDSPAAPLRPAHREEL